MDDVMLCNMALGQISARTTIQGINPPAPANNLAAETASMLFATQRDAVFRAAHWNCARFQIGATLLGSAIGTPENPSGALPAPPIPWRYMYAYPSDCLLVRFVFPLTQPPNTSPSIMTNVGANFYPVINTSMPFVPAYVRDPASTDPNARIRVVLTDACRAQMVYTARVPNPDMWDVSLQNAVIATLAAWFVNPIARNEKLLAERAQVAGNLINQARVSDGNEGISSVDHYPDWIQIRNAGGWGGWDVPGGGFMASWDSLGMPNGVSY